MVHQKVDAVLFGHDWVRFCLADEADRIGLHLVATHLTYFRAQDACDRKGAYFGVGSTFAFSGFFMGKAQVVIDGNPDAIRISEILKRFLHQETNQ